MPKVEKKKTSTKTARGTVKSVVQNGKKYISGKEKRIKREGEKIPRKLEHKGKINKYDAVDRIAKARQGRVHDATGIYKQRTSVKGQYFRTGLAKEEILQPQAPRNSQKPKAGNRLEIESGQVQQIPRKITGNKVVERASTRVTKTRNNRSIKAAHRPPLPLMKRQRKLGKTQIKRNKQPSQNYTEIRNRFELASGGGTVLEGKAPLITTQSEAPQEENSGIRQRQIRARAKPVPKLVPLEYGIVESSQKEEEAPEGEKPMKIHGVELVGLGSKKEKSEKKPTVISQWQHFTTPNHTVRVNKITRNNIKKIQKTRKNIKEQRNIIGEIAVNMAENSPFSKEDGTLVARRIRKIPGKKLKKHDLVLEEIHEWPPITVRKKELKIKFGDINPEKFAELRKKYRLLNSIITVRNMIKKCAKFTKNTCRKIFANIIIMFSNDENSRNLKLSPLTPDG